MRNTVADGANGIIGNITIAATLKYLSNFWRSFEMLLINCKIELKLKWTKHCVLFTNGNDNDHANSNNIILATKDKKLYVPIVTLSTEDNQKPTKSSLQKIEEISVLGWIWNKKWEQQYYK